eukprot:g48161.t1
MFSVGKVRVFGVKKKEARKEVIHRRKTAFVKRKVRITRIDSRCQPIEEIRNFCKSSRAGFGLSWWTSKNCERCRSETKVFWENVKDIGHRGKDIAPLQSTIAHSTPLEPSAPGSHNLRAEELILQTWLRLHLYFWFEALRENVKDIGENQNPDLPGIHIDFWCEVFRRTYISNDSSVTFPQKICQGATFTLEKSPPLAPITCVRKNLYFKRRFGYISVEDLPGSHIYFWCEVFRRNYISNDASVTFPKQRLKYGVAQLKKAVLAQMQAWVVQAGPDALKARQNRCHQHVLILAEPGGQSLGLRQLSLLLQQHVDCKALLNINSASAIWPCCVRNAANFLMEANVSWCSSPSVFSILPRNGAVALPRNAEVPSFNEVVQACSTDVHLIHEAKSGYELISR